MGSAAAWQLAKRGREVTLLERYGARHAMGASHGRTRNFNVAYADPTYQAMVQEAERLWRELEGESGATLLDLVGLVVHGEGVAADADAELRALGVEAVDARARGGARAVARVAVRDAGAAPPPRRQGVRRGRGRRAAGAGGRARGRGPAGDAGRGAPAARRRQGRGRDRRHDVRRGHGRGDRRRVDREAAGPACQAAEADGDPGAARALRDQRRRRRCGRASCTCRRRATRRCCRWSTGCSRRARASRRGGTRSVR